MTTKKHRRWNSNTSSKVFLLFETYRLHKRQSCSVHAAEFEVHDDGVWAWQDTDSSSVLSCCIIKDSRSPESRHSQTKGPLWRGLHTATWDHPLLSGWQLVTLAIVLQPGHPSWLTPYSGSGGVGPTGRTHGGRWEHSVTLNDIHQLIIGFSQTCTTSGNIGCFSSTPRLPSLYWTQVIFSVSFTLPYQPLS